MASTKQERLRRFYERFDGSDQVLILINADPDAIASAMAVKRLLWRKVAGITIAHVNVIQRPDNLTMVRLLGVNMVHIDEIGEASFTKFALVDSQPCHHEHFQKYRFDVVIDHHPDTSPDAGYKDIRPRYGATASMMTEYLRAARIKPSGKLAAGLFYAIKTDTSDFERETQNEDLAAFQFLFRHANIPLARRIEQADLKMEFLKYFRRAIENRRFRKGWIFAHLGSVGNPDVLVLIADFFLRIDTVHWTIISGVYQRKLVVIMRNDGIRKNAGKVAKEGFGALGSAGGHPSMARAEIPMAKLSGTVDNRDPKKILNWIIDRIQRRAGEAR
ncbi:MAG: DHH family phosphoesterase [Desulfobacterales bacterium]|jgi:nanoRNase/pAp phosphatase (c-di-AMP/oligoRNAs hydrolase)